MNATRTDRNGSPRTAGFLTDSTLCIGCKACEVACKEWNQVPADGLDFTGLSYDNTRSLGASTWRHVQSVEHEPEVGCGGNDPDLLSWQFSSDVCKHCEVAGCLEACPTGAIVRTEQGAVYVQPDVCNGCGYCVVGCPFGVVDQRPDDGRVFKCTFCYDRQSGGLEPACASVCPTDSILFGELDELRERAAGRLAHLHSAGMDDAELWDPRHTSVQGTHAIFIVRGDPRAYNLPPNPEVPTVHLGPGWRSAAAAAAGLAAVSALSFLVGGAMREATRSAAARERRLGEIRRRAAAVGAVAGDGVRPPGAPFPRADAASGYYGQPLLKPPVWTWEVPAYFFVGGAAGAAAVVAAAARAAGPNGDGRGGEHRRLVRDARWVAAAGAAVAPALLVADLGRPERFLNMLRVFKLQSPMSVGAWTLTAFSTAAAAQAFAGLVDERLGGSVPVRVVGDAAGALAAATGAVMASYTGVLIGATAIPAWNRNVRALPVHFTASGLASAVAVLELLGHRQRALDRLGVAAAATETLIGARHELDRHPATRPLKRGRSGWTVRAGGVLSGPLALGLRLAGRRRAAALAALAGSLLTRFGWAAAGKPSAEDPAVPLELGQPARRPAIPPASGGARALAAGG